MFNACRSSDGQNPATSLAAQSDVLFIQRDAEVTHSYLKHTMHKTL